MTINSDVQKLEPGAKVEFYELDATAIGGGILFFHANPFDGPIFWNEQEYSLYPIQAEGFSRTTDQQPNPKVKVANINGTISLLCQMYEDLVGAMLIRRRTFVKYLDPQTFDGKEMVANGTFDNDIAGWAQVSGSVGWQTGRIRLTYTNIRGRASYPIKCVPGKTYKVKFDRYLDGVLTYASIYIAISPTSTTGAVASDTAPGEGTGSLEFTATSDQHWVIIQTGGATAAGQYVEFDNISVREKGVNATADATQEFDPEVWFIDRKVSEDAEVVEFELASALNFQGVRLPRRQIIANQCPWVYRGPGCGYTGPAVADILDQPTSDPQLDRCGKRYQSCKLRQWPDDILNYGGFLAAGLVRV